MDNYNQSNPDIQNQNQKVDSQSSPLEKTDTLENKSKIKNSNYLCDKSTKSFHFIFLLFILLSGINLISNVYFYLQKQKLENYRQKENLILLTEKYHLSSSFADNLENLNIYFPNKSKVILLINALNRVGESFAQFSLTFPQDEPFKKGQKYLPLIISVRGEKNKVNDFLNTLFKSNYLFQIQNLNLSFEKNDNNTYNYQDISAVFKLNLLIADNF